MDDALKRMREKLARARDQVLEPPPGTEDRTILRTRARELARELSPPVTGESLEVVAFRLGRERLAVETRWVREVIVPRDIVPVPCTPAFIAGIVNLRGSIVSMVDLRQVLGLPVLAGEEAASALILSDGEMEFGVLAHRVEEAREFFCSDLAPPLPTLPEEALHFQRGVLPGPVALLDARRILASPQLRVGADATP